MRNEIANSNGVPRRAGASVRVLAAAAALCAGAADHARAQVTENILYSFADGNDGSFPTQALLVQTGGPSGAAAALYGSTFTGGSHQCAGGGCGTLFSLTPPKSGNGPWSETTLWDFTGRADGDEPYTTLTPLTKRISAKTRLYGTTANGGTNGSGTVFSIVHGQLTTIYTFNQAGVGGFPIGGIVADKTGALYTGTAAYGGGSSCGTVVMLTPPGQGQTVWTETTIWTFTGGNDGCSPGALIIDPTGALYGATFSGGSGGAGTIFKLTPPPKGQAAWTEQSLSSFSNGSGGGAPSDPIIGKDGDIYDTTLHGGVAGDCPNTGCGTVFRLIPPQKGGTAWTEQVLWSFTGGSDGQFPHAAPILDKNGALYGTATAGGANGDGMVYRMVPPAKGQTAWTKTTLLDFNNTDGSAPLFARLTADKQGTLYGDTSAGGTTGNGLVFSLTGTGFVTP